MVAEAPVVLLTPLARADLEDIWRYTAANWSMQQADDYFRTLEAVFEGLAVGQKISTAVDVRAGYRKYVAGSHVIYFMPLPAGIEIVRILHHGMDVSRHLQGVT